MQRTEYRVYSGGEKMITEKAFCASERKRLLS